jgi:hypothetical protein
MMHDEIRNWLPFVIFAAGMAGAGLLLFVILQLV